MARKRSSAEEKPSSPETFERRRPPLVFISHDNRDAGLAEAFEYLLRDASGGTLKAFRSSDRGGASGIEFGTEWYTAVMEKLNEASDVVALLTPRSIERPWILYEVGVAKGKTGRQAFGVTFGVPLSRIAGPFAQFQNSDDEEDSLTKLVLQLIRRNPDADPREEAVRLQVAAFRQQLPKINVPLTSSAEEVDASVIAKLFEEVKAMFRELPQQIASKLGDVDIRKVSTRPNESWRARAAQIIASLRGAGPDSRARAWEKYLDHMALIGDLPRSAVDVWLALNDEDDGRFLASATEFLQSQQVRNSESVGDEREMALADYVESGAAVLRYWLDQAQPPAPKRRK